MEKKIQNLNKEITMRKLLLMLGLLFTATLGHTYSFYQLKEDLIKDTKEVFLKDVKTGLYYDFLERGYPDRYKFGLSSQLLAYKFFSLEPVMIYTPNSAGSIAEFGLSFPIRLGYIPIGDGQLLKDLAPEGSKNSVIDRLFLGFYASQNLTTGRFGFGVGTGLKF